MDRPVVAPFRIFAGAVERVDDPDPRPAEPRLVVGALLRKHRVARPPLGEAGQDEGVGDLVGDMAERRAFEQGAGALLDQQPPRFLGQMRGQLLVGQMLLPHRAVKQG